MEKCPEFWIDVGGTFTDCFLVRPGESPRMLKCLSVGAAPVTAIRRLLGKRDDEPIGRVRVRLGTTRGTNALLERRGARVAFLTTKGFGDALEIGHQNRPKLFALAIEKRRPLYEVAAEIDERLARDGRVLRPLDEAAARATLGELKERGIESLAIALLHAYRNPAHEERLAELAGEAGFSEVSVSSRLSPVQRLVPRAETTVVDAYLTPILRDYLAELRRRMPDATIEVMTSAGGLVPSESFRGRDSILSGPAGGVVGTAAVAGDHACANVIGFDMGGTSTDVCRFGGEYERRFEMELIRPGEEAGVNLVAPMMAIETVAAGGGSICWFDGVGLRVGPRSAGADPGPACYGKGGPLTVTDLNLLLGRLLPDRFPFPLDAAAATSRIDAIADEIFSATGKRPERDALAWGFRRVANAHMAAAIKKVSVERGYDPRLHALVSFGGAGAQHACHLAESLGMTTILQSPFASCLSAYGIGLADVTRFAERDGHGFGDLEARLRAELAGSDGETSAKRWLDVRYRGQDATITVPADGDWKASFDEAHRRLYGFTFARAAEVRTSRVEVTVHRPRPRTAAPVLSGEAKRETRRAYFGGAWLDVPVIAREGAGEVAGPAIIIEPATTIVVEPGWTARVDGTGLVLRRTAEAAERDDADVSDPISLALFQRRFAAIAEQMGATLQRTALSVNIKERLDFSCAIFTADGRLVVNAPHIPVHLGSMGETVRALLARVRDVRAGDVYVTNHPFLGGSHLPDVTVLTPVFVDDKLLFFTGARAHHAEIGGISPGSMPPFGRNLAEEGVVIPFFRLVRGGVSDRDGLRDLLTAGPYGSRAPDDNLADIQAQVAANECGRASLAAMVAEQGAARVTAAMESLREATRRIMGERLRALGAGEYRFSDTLDDGSRITVAITIAHEGARGRAVVDFAGTSPVSAGNWNANPAIARAAVLYCFRCLIDEEVPLNDGFLEPIEIRVPAGSLLNPPTGDDPTRLAAVVGGNVETSQRVVDVIFGALGAVAASQGTMNNLLFGRAGGPADGPAFGYYETICGGAGAGPTFAGASAVHTHMTNTRITDPEVIEDRYPVRLHRFARRALSGGPGKHAGGDGVVREIEFLEPLDVSLLTSRRVTRPFGLSGGGAGAAGVNRLNGEELPHATFVRVAPGDRLVIETPGGGGYGRP